MKKSIVVTLLLLITVTNTFSQPKYDNITFHDKMKVWKRFGWFTKTLGIDNDGIYFKGIYQKSILSRDLGQYISYYDRNYNHVKTIALQKKIGKRNIFSVNYIDGKIYVLSSYKNTEKNLHTLFVQTLNKKTLVLEDDLRPIKTMKFDPSKRASNIGKALGVLASRLLQANVTYRPGGNSDIGYYSGYVSPNNKNIVLCSEHPFYSDSDLKKIELSLFNTEFEQKWNYTITLPYANNLFDITQVLVDDNNNVYILAQVYNTKRQKRIKGKSNYKYVLIQYTHAIGKHTEYSIDLNGKFISDITIDIQDDNYINCAGFFAEENPNAASGLFTAKFDKNTNKTVHLTEQHFPFDIVTRYHSKIKKRIAQKRLKKGKQVELNHLVLKDIISQKDGGILMMFSEHTVTVHASNSKADTYERKDIFVTSISKDGDIKWFKRIPAYFRSVFSYSVEYSYIYYTNSQKLRIFLNGGIDDLKNSGDKEIERKPSYGNTILGEYTVDSLGNVSKKPLFKISHSEVVPCPKIFEFVGKDEIFMWARYKREARFVTIKLEE